MGGSNLGGLGAFLRSFAEAAPDRKQQMVQQMRELATAQAQTIQAVTAHEQLGAARSENELARMLAPSRIALAQAQAKSMTAGAERTVFEVEELKREAQEKELAMQNMSDLLNQVAPEGMREYLSSPANIALLLKTPGAISALQQEAAGVAAGLPGARVEKEVKEVGAAVSEAELRAQRAGALVQEREPVQAARTQVAGLKAAEAVAPLKAPQAQADLELRQAQATEIMDLLPAKKRLTDAQVTLAEAKAKQMEELGAEPETVTDLIKLTEFRYREELIDKIVESGVITDRSQAAAYVADMGGPLDWLRSMKAIQDLLNIQESEGFSDIVLRAMNLTAAASEEQLNAALEELRQQYEELNTMYTALFGRRVGQAAALAELSAGEPSTRVTDEERRALEEGLR